MSSQRIESSRQVIQTYRSSMAPRETIIHRSTHGAATGYGLNSNTMLEHNRAVGTYRSAGSGNIILELTERREKEKKEMQNLNQRFAYYVSQVKFYATQQRGLDETITALRRREGAESKKIETLFMATFDDVEEFKEGTKRDLYEFKVKSQKQEKEEIALRKQLEQATLDCGTQRKNYENQCLAVNDLEAEISTMRHTLNLLELDREQNKRDCSQVTGALNRAKIDLSKEELLHVEFKNRRLTLEVELENMKHDHDEKIKELTDAAFSDTTQENQRVWENDMSPRLRDIQQEHEVKFKEMRVQSELSYSLKIQEIETGSKRREMETGHAVEEVKRTKSLLTTYNAKLAHLFAKNSQLKSEFDSLSDELTFKKEEWEEINLQLRKEQAKLMAEKEAILMQGDMLAKYNLEKQITEYRNLLEGTRNTVGLRQICESLWEQKSGGFNKTSLTYRQSHEIDSNQSSIQMSKFESGEMTAKTTYERNAKGPVSITECEGNGAFVALGNQGRKDEDLSGWSIRRVVDGREYCNVALDDDLEIRSGGKIKLYANGSKPMGASRNDREVEIDTWGRGINVTTSLLNPHGEEQATHQQTTHST